MSKEDIQHELTQPYGDRPPPTWHWGPQELHPALLDWGGDPPTLAFDGTHCLPAPLLWTEQHILDLTSRGLKPPQQAKRSGKESPRCVNASQKKQDAGWQKAIRAFKESEDSPPATTRMGDAFGKAQLREGLALKLDKTVNAKQHGGSTYRSVFHSQDLFQPGVQRLPST